MLRAHIYFWKRMPFVRVLLPFIAGIIMQWKWQLSLTPIGYVLIASFVFMLLFEWLPVSGKYAWRWTQGLVLLVFLASFGGALSFLKNGANKPDWIGSHYKDSSALLLTIQEPLVEKENSYKAEAKVEAIRVNSEWQAVSGKILVYFTKEVALAKVGYGTQIILQKTLQPIRNSGNPGAFNYVRYTSFQNIYYQVFLKSNEYVVAGTLNANPVRKWLFATRKTVVEKLRRFINGDKEKGVAEALLIGYKNDLDKDLVQAYSNTGVVHIIAISGLHLGMIYLLLVVAFKPFRNRKGVRWIKPLVMLLVLWTFSLLAGGAASIIRSAVMFSFIIIGESLDRKPSIYNTLAASALLMLVYNPYYLWDVGFQLSYAAVISIVTFMTPVYNWLYVKNKILDFFWKLSSITLSAQVLTFPIIIFYFHQFPNLFMITNFVVVPMATVILYGELMLVAFSFFEPLARGIGFILSGLIRGMNGFIEHLNNFSFTLTDGIYINAPETLLLYLFLVAFTYALMRKYKPSLFVSMAFLVLLFASFGLKKRNVDQQQKIVVYNVPKHQAIDFIDGTKYFFVGDDDLRSDNFLRNFHLKPARVQNQVLPAGYLGGLAVGYPFIEFNGKRILVIDKGFRFSASQKVSVDMIVLSKNPRIYISKLAEAFDCKLFVFDSSNPVWKMNLWKKDCDSLHLRHHSTAEGGALEWDLAQKLQ